MAILYYVRMPLAMPSTSKTNPNVRLGMHAIVGGKLMNNELSQHSQQKRTTSSIRLDGRGKLPQREGARPIVEPLDNACHAYHCGI